MNTLKIGALGLVVALAACNSDGTGPDLSPLETRILNRDVALAAADAASEDVEVMGGPTGTYGFGFGPSLEVADPVRPFRCGTHQRENLTIVRTCTFQDAGGATQPGYDPLTTASATVHAEVDGEISRANWSASVHRIRDLTVTGLAGTETQRTWNGTGSGSSTRSRHTENGEPRQYDISGSTVITDVVVPVPHTEDAWPLSGTITHQVTVDISGGPHDGETRSRTVTITFNGTQFVPITVNENTFTFDLKLRRIVRDDN